MDGHGSWHIRQVAHPHEVGAGLRGQLTDGLDPRRSRLLLALDAGVLAG